MRTSTTPRTKSHVVLASHLHPRASSCLNRLQSLRFQDSNESPAAPITPSSPPPPHTMDYNSTSCIIPQSERYLPSTSTRTTPRSLLEYVSTTRQLPDPTKDEDLHPLPELPSDKPMLARANTPSAKELVGPSITILINLNHRRLTAARAIARCVSTIQEIWYMPVDRGIPLGIALVGHNSTVTSAPLPQNPIHAPPPNPEVVAAAASVDVEHISPHQVPSWLSPTRILRAIQSTAAMNPKMIPQTIHPLARIA